MIALNLPSVLPCFLPNSTSFFGMVLKDLVRSSAERGRKPAEARHKKRGFKILSVPHQVELRHDSTNVGGPRTLPSRTRRRHGAFPFLTLLPAYPCLPPPSPYFPNLPLGPLPTPSPPLPSLPPSPNPPPFPPSPSISRHMHEKFGTASYAHTCMLDKYLCMHMCRPSRVCWIQ
jgi:hypothetical protein